MFVNIDHGDDCWYAIEFISKIEKDELGEIS